jgi:hypothetical protein
MKEPHADVRGEYIDIAEGRISETCNRTAVMQRLPGYIPALSHHASRSKIMRIGTRGERAQVKLPAPTSGTDDRTDDCACGAGKEIRKLNFGRVDGPALPILRLVLHHGKDYLLFSKHRRTRRKEVCNVLIAAAHIPLTEN